MNPTICYNAAQTYRAADLNAYERPYGREWVRVWAADDDSDALAAFAERLAWPRELHHDAETTPFAYVPAHYKVTAAEAAKLKALGAQRTTLRAWLLTARTVMA